LETFYRIEEKFGVHAQGRKASGRHDRKVIHQPRCTAIVPSGALDVC
jgi:hypothetical protein